MARLQIPPGGTWFDTHKKSFQDVPIDPNDKGISTSEFLDAAESTTTLFDLLGSVAFTPVKSDMTGNIKKVRDRQLAAPLESTTLQQLVKSELATKKHTATEGLLWLVRGLDFTAQSLREDIKAGGSQELSQSFRTAYKTTLGPHHSFLVKPVFSAAMSATPYRKDFAVKLAGGNSDTSKAEQDMVSWVEALEERIAILKEFLASKEAKW